jgi:hypothetical protein
MLIVVYPSVMPSPDAFLRDSAGGRVNARLNINESFPFCERSLRAPSRIFHGISRHEAFSGNIYKVATVFRGALMRNAPANAIIAYAALLFSSPFLAPRLYL